MIHNYSKYLQQLLLPIYTNTTLATTANDNNTASHTITSKTVNITLMLLFLLSLIANYQTSSTKTKTNTTFTTPAFSITNTTALKIISTTYIT